MNCCHHGRRNYTCVLLPFYLLSDLLPLPPSQTKCTVYTDSVWLGWGGGVVLNCTVDHILQEFYTLFLTRFRSYKIISPPQTKMTSKDSKGLVSLKFLSPCVKVLTLVHISRCTRRSCTSSCRVTSPDTSTSTWTRRFSSSLPEGRLTCCSFNR